MTAMLRGPDRRSTKTELAHLKRLGNDTIRLWSVLGCRPSKRDKVSKNVKLALLKSDFSDISRRGATFNWLFVVQLTHICPQLMTHKLWVTRSESSKMFPTI